MTGPYEIQITRDFLRQLHSFDASIFRKWQRIGSRFYSDPFHPSLQTEQIHHAEDGIYSARLDDNYRFIFKLVKPTTIILAWVDTHDKAYAKARRISIALQDGMVRIVETVVDAAQPKHLQPAWNEKLPDFLFQKQSDQSLSEMGIPAEFLPKLRKLTEINELEAFEEQLPTNLYDKLLNLVWPDIVKKPESTDEEIREQIDKEPNQLDLALIDTSQEFERALEGSIQEWMLFLHPSQKQVVEATYTGPARIKGVAGSGKTVVALHRARFLAKSAPRGQKVLFLTYSNRLAGVAEELITLLCGNGSERAAIEVRTLHSWCKRFLGDSVNITKGEDQRRAFSDAIQAVLSKRPESRLRQFSQTFVEEEIGAVIQGRALGNRDTYLALKRIGRGKPLSDDDRQMIFSVYEEYKKRLRPEIDFNDLVLLALQKIKREAQSTDYYGVVVDEIQDLPSVPTSLRQV